MVKDLIFFISTIFIIIFVFYIKNKNKDNSISLKIMNIILREYPIIIFIIGMYTIITYIHIKVVDKIFNIYILYHNLNSNLIYITKFIYYFFNKLITSILNVDVIKIIIISSMCLKILGNGDLFEKVKYIIKQIKEINIKGITIKTNEAEKEKVQVQSEIDEIQKQQQNGTIHEEDADKQIKDAEYKKKIISILINNDIVVELLYKVIELKGKDINVPLNFIRKKVNLNDISRIFTCDINSSSLIINGIIPEKETLIKEVFKNLKSKNIIYYNH